VRSFSKPYLRAVLISALVVACQQSHATETPPEKPKAPEQPLKIDTVVANVSAPVRKALGGQKSIVIALNAADCFTCEDLGRQLREIVRASSERQWAIAVIAPSSDSLRVETWLRRQRIHRDRMIWSEIKTAFIGSPPPTPAVIIVAANGTTVRGIAHKQRVRNARVRSFAQELDLI
jgi:hypothetical protein